MEQILYLKQSGKLLVSPHRVSSNPPFCEPRPLTSTHARERTFQLDENCKTQKFCNGKMGQSGSSSAVVSELPTPRGTVSRHVATFKKLYAELSSPEETGEPPNDDLFRVRPRTDV